MAGTRRWQELGARLTEARVAAGYTARECAARLNVYPHTYRCWERGISRPDDFNKFTEIGEALSVSPAWLAFGIGERVPAPPAATAAPGAPMLRLPAPAPLLPALPDGVTAARRVGPAPPIHALPAYAAARARRRRAGEQTTFVAYLRVSTADQAKFGASLKAQMLIVRRCIHGKGKLICAFREVESARLSVRYRPALAQAIELCRRERATLVVSKLDRLTRNVAFLSALLSGGIEVVVADLPQANRLTLHLLAAIAEYESDVISERHRAAHAIGKELGRRYGYESMSKEKRLRAWYNAGAVVRAKSRAILERVAPLLRSFHAAGITNREEMARILNKNSVPTMHGKRWHSGTVRAIAARMSPPILSPNEISIMAQRRARTRLADILEVFDSGKTSYQQIADEMNRRGFKSPNGYCWRPSTIAQTFQLCGLTLEDAQRRLAQTVGLHKIWRGFRTGKIRPVRRRHRHDRRRPLPEGRVTLPPEFLGPLAATKFVAYLRVSSPRQMTGLGLESQRREIRAYAASKGPIIGEFVEFESAYKKGRPRPQLAAAIGLCRREHAALLVARLDRLARNVAFVVKLMESGIEFLALDAPSANRLTVHVLAAFAEYESQLHAERIRAAMAVHRLKGPPEKGWASWTNARKLRFSKQQSARGRAFADRFAQAIHPIIDELRAKGFRTYRQLAAGLTHRGVPSRRDRPWSAMAVQVVDRRCRPAIETANPLRTIHELARKRYYMSRIAAAQKRGLFSYETLARALNAQRLRRIRGGRWNRIGVARTMAEAGVREIVYKTRGITCTYVVPPVGAGR